MQPIIPVYDIRGNFAGTKASTMGSGRNPLSDLYKDKDDYTHELRLLGNIHITINFTKDLSFKSLLGIDNNNNNKLDRYLVSPEYSETIITPVLTRSYGGGLQNNWSNTLSYNKTISEDHKISVLLGAEEVNSFSESYYGSRATFAFTDVNYMVLDAGELNQLSGGNFDQWKTFSYFGRLNYDYMGKYLFEAVVRRDGSSRFSSANRWGTFPAFSAGWRLSEERFMDNLKWITDLKLRFGWGQNGNDNVGNYNAYSTYRANVNESYYNITGTSGTQSSAGFHQYKLGNPAGRWESTSTTNIGVDATLLNKFEVVLDVYRRLTTGMLYPEQLPQVWGTLLFPSINIGEMKNTGVDLTLTYHGNIRKEFFYNVRGNISHFKNEVIKLNDNPAEIIINGATATKAGQPISSFYGYIVDGIFNTQEEVGAYPKFNPDVNGKDVYSQPGVFKYRDVNGDGKITSDDRTFIGSPHPKLSYGLNIGLEYKKFDLNFFLTGVMGNKVFNSVNRAVLFTSGIGNRLKRRLYESWTPERYTNGDKITLPIALLNDANESVNSSFFVEDGSYARMKDLQIGYTLPQQVASKLKIERLHIYLQISNLFTLTKYSGLDPEILSTDNTSFGVDSGVYPTSQTFMFGVNLDL
jgi:TonB-linked SusC/RagA family outer membrane protein